MLHTSDNVIHFNSVQLNFFNNALPLGHLLPYDLNDKDDITRVNQKPICIDIALQDPCHLHQIYRISSSAI